MSDYRDAVLKFFYGPMDCGKSTLALQMHHNQARQGRTGLARGAAPGGRWFVAWSPRRGDRQAA